MCPIPNMRRPASAVGGERYLLLSDWQQFKNKN